jgi:hypothetical protein
VILECADEYPIYIVLPGGAFVFNGGCYSPLEPFGPLGVEETTWGAIKELYQYPILSREFLRASSSRRSRPRSR